MSTTIQVFPTTADMPLVEHTRARTQELFEQLFIQNGISLEIEVVALHPRQHEPSPVAHDLVWATGLHLTFGYWINGTWNSSSFPSCYARETIEKYEVEPCNGEKPDFPQEMLGKQRPLESDDFGIQLPQQDLDILNAQDHYWDEYRNFGSTAIASIGYGFVAASLAEATRGRITTGGSAFDWEHCGETAQDFLQWWGQKQFTFYQLERFTGTHHF